MEKVKHITGRRRIEFTATGKFDSWMPAEREFLETMMPETISKRTASSLFIVVGLGNEEITRLTGMCHP